MDEHRRRTNLKSAPSHLQTPVYLKTHSDVDLPHDRSAYYVLASDGLYLCRETEFFRSCVRAPDWPSELAKHQPYLQLRYPRIPQHLIERVVGFFDLVGKSLGSEAAVLLAWDPATQQIQTVVPEQCGFIGYNFHGATYPISLDYQVPSLPSGWRLIGDIHSHVDMAAYASGTDKEDELHRPGLHLVVGRIYRDPPEFHCEVTVDGQRFLIGDLDQVMEGYTRRRTDCVPDDWMKKVRTQPFRPMYENSRSRS